MPVTAPAIASAIQAAAPELQGADWKRLVQIVGSAVATWVVVPANVALSGITTGTAGGGAVVGSLMVPPNTGPLLAAFTANGLLGPNAPSVARAIGVGVATSLSTSARYQGVSTGVGVGQDVSRITVANPTTLTSITRNIAVAQGMGGSDMVQLSVAIGTGVSAILLAGTGTGSVTGGTGPVPATGVSVSSVL